LLVLEMEFARLTKKDKQEEKLKSTFDLFCFLNHQSRDFDSMVLCN